LFSLFIKKACPENWAGFFYDIYPENPDFENYDKG